MNKQMETIIKKKDKVELLKVQMDADKAKAESVFDEASKSWRYKSEFDR